jgi:sirohydrochlorin cobaltochelatase
MDIMTTEDTAALAQLEARLDTLLPAEYRGAVDTVQPTPMRSAGLRFDGDGRVAWDEIWGSFCDLAVAGGPPHKGHLLQPGTPVDISAALARHAEVVQEICRGVRMVADLEGAAAPDAGWVRFRSFNDAMAAWLLRAITTENVAVRVTGNAVDLPAAPSFRLEKEIKNVITVMAKTCHYWVGHMPREQQQAIGRIFDTMAAESPLLVPAVDGSDVSDVRTALARRVPRTTALHVAGLPYPGWFGVEIPGVRAAIWMMRAMVAHNVLARREHSILYLPIQPAEEPGCDRVLRTLSRVHHLATAKGLL